MVDVMKKPRGAKSIPAPKVELPSVRQPTAITIRGSKEWRAWVEGGAKHCLTDTSKLVDIALARYLKEQGYDAIRPER